MDDDIDYDEELILEYGWLVKGVSNIPSWDHCQKISLSQNSDTPRIGFELVQNLNSDFVE